MSILIISKDKDFSSVVAEQVKRELSLTCQVAETMPAKATASLIITDEDAPESMPCPVISVKPPVRLWPLLENIDAALNKPAESALVLPQGYSLHLRQKQLAHTASGKTVDLTDKEAHLLQKIAEAGSKGIAKDQLLKDVWGIEALLDTHTLETHIYRLRGKFKELAGVEMIEAVEGGYALAFS